MFGNFLGSLFENVGGKLKKLIKVVCTIGIVISLIAAICVLIASVVIAINSNWLFLLVGLFGAPLVFVVGTFVCWISCASAYIMGANAENIERLNINVGSIQRKLRNGVDSISAASANVRNKDVEDDDLLREEQRKIEEHRKEEKIREKAIKEEQRKKEAEEALKKEELRKERERQAKEREERLRKEAQQKEELRKERELQEKEREKEKIEQVRQNKVNEKKYKQVDGKQRKKIEENYLSMYKAGLISRDEYMRCINRLKNENK